MRGNSDVSAAGRNCRPRNMSRALSQDFGVVALKDDRGELQSWDIELTDHVAAPHWGRRRWAMDCRRLGQPFFRTALRGSLLVERPPTPGQKSSAPDHQGAAE